MKKFVSQIALFLLLPTLLCIFVLLSPLKRKFAYNSLPTDCDGRGSWIWSRLYSDTSAIDVAFLGSSHTINGIQDTLIGRLMETELHRKMNVVNLGYCRFGNEMQYVIAKDLFATKKPKMIFVEVNEKFGTASHPVYPYYAETHELLQPASYVQQAYPPNLYSGFLARLSQFRSELFNAPDTIVPVPLSYGYRGYPNAVDPGKLIPAEKKVAGKMGAWRSFQTQYPEAWISDLVELCRNNHTQIIFLYIPSFHDQPQPMEGMDFYSSMAPLLIPPQEILTDKQNWRDPDHLNDKGATLLAHWIFTNSPLEK